MNYQGTIEEQQRQALESGQRTNSISSFNSFTPSINSTSINNTHHVPRSSSTNDLFTVTPKFNKPTRKHLVARGGPGKTLSMTSTTSDFNRRKIDAPSRSFQSGSVNDMLTINIPPSKRKSSLQTHHNPYQAQKLQNHHQYPQQSPRFKKYPGQNHHQQQYPNAHTHQFEQPARYTGRHVHNAPFTFPNGEVYIPRAKQRGSFSKASELKQFQRSAAPPPPPSHSSTASFEKNVPHSQSITRAQPHPQPHPLPHTQNHSLTVSIDSTSTSPSPSGTSRTNSSVQETTPASSFDDLSLSHSTEAEPLVLATTNEHRNLSMIEESPDTTTNGVGKPINEFSALDMNPSNIDGELTGPKYLVDTIKNTDMVESKLEGAGVLESEQEIQLKSGTEAQSKTDVDPEILVEALEDTSPSPIEAKEMEENIPALKPTSIELPQAKETSKPVPIEVAEPRSTAPTINTSQNGVFHTIPVRKQSKSTKKPPTESISPPKKTEKKGSIVKRFFSRVFSRSGSLKRSASKTTTQSKPLPTKVLQKKTTQSSTSTQINSTVPNSIATDPKTSTDSPITSTNSETIYKPVSIPHQKPFLTDNTSDADQFSFFEGDEENGLRIGETADGKDNDLLSDDALSFIFSKLSGSDDPNDDAVKRQRALEAALKSDNDFSNRSNYKSDVIQHENAIEEDDNQVISLDDIDFIEKIIEFGETSFPDLAAPDLGQSQRKMLRSKSIERKKSIRSMGSSSKEIITAATEMIDTEESIQIEIILTNQPKEPPTESQSEKVHSILKKNNTSSITNRELESVDNLKGNVKKVDFTNRIFVNNTHAPHIYNRHPTPLSIVHLSPHSIQQIRYDLNEFKSRMKVHQDSVSNTHYFR